MVTATDLRDRIEHGDENITPQDLFEAVVRHLAQQGRQAIGVNGWCAYRGSNGAMCAIGCLIPDSLYDPRVEGLDVTGLIDMAAVDNLGVLGRLMEKYGSLLGELQGLHDDAVCNGGFLEDAAEIGRGYQLDMSFFADLDLSNLRDGKLATP